MNEIEVVAIGEEVLRGTIVNSNAAEISRTLFQAGYRPGRHSTLPDDEIFLGPALQECLARSRIVIATGGLGPTCDDLTSRVAAKLFDSDSHYDEALAGDLKKRYGNALINIEHQASVPTKAFVLKNPIGTAAGLIFHDDRSTLILMPGVPREMRVMLQEQVLPYLKRHFPKRQAYSTQGLHFFGISESAIDPFLRELHEEYREVEFGIYPSHGILNVQATIQIADDKEGQRLLSRPMKELAERFSTQVFESPSGKIEEAVHLLFIDNGWTLSTAESCTGGGIAARLIKLPDASKYFEGSIVCYSNALKMSLLGVPETQLREHGAVSKETVAAMATGVIKVTGTEFGVAISGIAGPSGGSPEKPVGTMWAAIIRKDHEPYCWQFRTYGSRDMMIEQSINLVLGELYRRTR